MLDRSLCWYAAACTARLLVFAGAHVPVLAQGLCEPQELYASDAAAGDQLGGEVAIDGDTMVVGADRKNISGNSDGAAYVFRWDGFAWSEEARLVASDQDADSDLFGSSVAIEGDLIVIGAQSDDDFGSSSGSAYVFERVGSTWSEVQKLTASDASSNDNFGESVAIQGETLFIGADTAPSSFIAAPGAVYVFERSGGVWTESQKLLAGNPDNEDSFARFGAALAVDCNVLLIGAPSEGTGQSSVSGDGAAYIFTRTNSGWVERAKLDPAAEDENDGNDDAFGSSVALQNGIAVIGAPNDDGPAGDRQGAAYVFTGAGDMWTEVQVLEPDHAAADDYYGNAVAIDGNTIAVGAQRQFGDGAGSVFLFRGSEAGWAQVRELQALDGGNDNNFGSAVSIDRNHLAVGAPDEDGAAGSDQGSVTTYRKVGPFWGGVQRLAPATADSSDPGSHGQDVAIDGEYAVMGLALADGVAGNDQGAAFVFKRVGETWVEMARLEASDAAAGDEFGFSADISGDRIVVGAWRRAGSAGLEQGAAYVFVRNGAQWIEEDILTASDALAEDRFGTEVRMHGDRILVGHFHLEDDIPGRVWLFERSGSNWIQRQILTASDGFPGNDFGIGTRGGLHIDDAMILVGDDNADSPLGVERGAVYVFERNGAIWEERQKITATDGSLNDFFGRTVSRDGSSLAVGAEGVDDLGFNTGALYIFQYDGQSWIEKQKILGSAEYLALFQDWLIVTNGNWILRAFRRAGASWTQVAEITGGPFGSISLDQDDLQAVAIEENLMLVSSSENFTSLIDIGGECFGGVVENSSSETAHADLPEAIFHASDTDVLTATPAAFAEVDSIDLLGKLLTIRSTGDIEQPRDADMKLSDGATVSTGTDHDLTFRGRLTIPGGDSVFLATTDLCFESTSDLIMMSNSGLGLDSTSVLLDGFALMLPGAVLVSPVPVQLDGDMTNATALFSAPSLAIGCSGSFIGDGDLFCNVVNRGEMITVDDTLISGDLVNGGGASITIQIGTLTLLGSLTNDGSIVGDLQTVAVRGGETSGLGGTQAGDGFSVNGRYAAGRYAELLLPDPVWRVRVEGDVDIAIDDSSRFDMSEAEMVIGAGMASTLEVLSTDIGADEAGLDRTMPGHFPIGTLRLSGGTTTLIDTHDNDGLGQEACEALYVRELIIESGATFETGACKVYYETLELDGDIDQPANLIEIAPDVCPGDADGNQQVNFIDLNIVLGNFQQSGAPGIPGDLNNDGVVNFLDLNIVLGNFQQSCE